jgi:hypothetical protein
VIESGYPEDMYRLHPSPVFHGVVMFLPYFHELCQF